MPKIVLAIDAYTSIDCLLRAALLLATEQDSQLIGVFARDERLPQGAALPWTQVIGAKTAECFPINAVSVENRISQIAAKMRQQLASVADRRNLHWEFSQRSGSIAQVADEIDADIVFLGWSGSQWGVETHSFRSFVRSATRQFMIVIDDGSPLSERVIRAAERYTAESHLQQLVVVSIPGRPSEGSRRSTERSHEKPAARDVRASSIEQLIVQIRLLRPALVLMGRDQPVSADSRLFRSLAAIGCPVAFLRTF